MNTALITLGILIALVLGFFAGRWHGMSKRSKQLSDKLEQKEEELSELKSNVNEHFSETARLFTNLTEEYKSLYQHLAQGASKLSDESFKLALGAPTAENLTQDTQTAEDHKNLSEQSGFNEEVTEVAEDEMVSEDVVQPVDYARPNSSEDNKTHAESDSDEKSASEPVMEEQSAAETTDDSSSEKSELDNNQENTDKKDEQASSKPVSS
ncbi:YhcB family protein [Kangiella sp. TOML190]|uniref:YhcB family protein n=1 Tax=Kangiella sp. TOML190 TaxID=2931351 RepID=UPI00203B76B9|nr:DUF1043 family protein [Kangiella sp. TOML190]